MKRRLFSILFSLCLAAGMIFLSSCEGKNERTQVVNLRCEYQAKPLGLDTPHPRFTWNFTSGEDGFAQQAWQIDVATSPELLQAGKPDVWSSGRTKGSDPLATYSGSTPLQSYRTYYWNVTVWDGSGNRCATSPTASFEMAKLSPSDWQAQWITDHHDKNYEPAPLFRKEFKAAKDIRQARAYVCGLGYYELFLNGKRVGENYLDPGYTAFDKRALYVTHDVTSLLKKGDNAVAAVLGNGWFNEQSVAVWNFHEARWRQRPLMLCEIRIDYTDGSTETIATDATWKTATGASIYNSIYSGDMYDARLEPQGWKEASFDDAGWQAARITSAPAPLLVAQQTPPIRVSREIEPIEMKAFGNKLYVFDLGENIAGLSRLRVKGEAGTRITLKHGELLKENGRLEQGNINVYYHPVDKKEVFQMDVYTLRGDDAEEVFMPSFAYHGFRYVEVESSRPVTLTKSSLTGLFMHTDVQPVGRFSCSNPLLNKIWEATNRSYLSNLHSIPTDCPQREKNGWTADAHVAIDLALLNYDGITFYEKWMDDFIDNQNAEGGISGIIPSAGWGYGDWPGPVWDAALFIIPTALHNYYGDTRCIEKMYPVCEKYLAYLEPKEKDGLQVNGIGDWLPYKAQTPTDFTSTAYYYLDYVSMARFATLLGKDAAPYQQKAATIKETFNRKFFNPETGVYANGTQTAQALPLYLGLVPTGKESLVASKLREVVAANNYFLNFGLLGSKTVHRMLSAYGYAEEAYRMVTKTDAPSWGYWIDKLGYTTLPETWILSPKFNDASLNHVFFGDVSAWMYNYLAGINFDPGQPGFSHFIVRPCFVKDLQWVKGEYNSVKGLIRSEWKRQDGKIVLTVTVPANTTATVYMGGKAETVKSGVHIFSVKE